MLSRPMVEEGYLDHWKQVALEQRSDLDYAFATEIGRLPKFIVTRRAITVEHPNTHVLNRPLAGAVASARRLVNGDLLCFGGAGLAAALLREQLVDELQLYINPGVAGQGQRILQDPPIESSFDLLDAVPTGSGIVISRWALGQRQKSEIQ